MRAVALTSLATGMVLALATGPYSGKETGETALLRKLFDALKPGDLLLSDRYFGRWFMLALLQDLGVATPEWVRQKLWTGLLAYNLTRQSMLQSALGKELRPNQLSFAASLQLLNNTWVLAAVPPLVSISARERLIALRILNGHSHRVGNRPNRVEPRAVKRRPNPIALLAESRKAARAKLMADTKA